MTTASDIIFLHTGTHASLPTGFTRETTLDDKFIYGEPTGTGDGGGTGGQATHDHTWDNHNHDFDLSGTVGNADGSLGTGRTNTTTHTHASKASGDGSGTSGTVANNTQMQKVRSIFVKSAGTNDPADGMIGFWDGAVGDIPTGYTKADGTGTKDLDEAWLEGAGTGADWTNKAGTDGHGHASSHNHPNTTSSIASGAATIGGRGGTQGSNRSHTHTVTFANADGNITDVSGTGTLPDWKTLIPIENTSGGELLVDGIIGLWIGLRASIPTDWAEVTSMRGFFLRCDVATAGTTGGSGQHNHAAGTHTHVGNDGFPSGTCTGADQNIGIVASCGHNNHTVNVSSETIVVNNNTNETNFPQYVKVIFIKYTAPSVVSGASKTFSRFRRGFMRR